MFSATFEDATNTSDDAADHLPPGIDGPTASVPSTPAKSTADPSRTAAPQPVPFLSRSEVGADNNTPRPRSGADEAREDEDGDASYAEFYRQVWKQNDKGAGGLLAIREGVDDVANSTALILLLVTLLPVSMFAPNFTKWQKNHISNLPIFVETFKSQHSHIYASILEVTGLKGSAAKKKVIDVSAQLFGTFDGELHSAFVYALMIYIWCAEESPRQNCVLALILQYVNTSQGGLAQLKVQCDNMFQGSITADNMVNIFPAGQMEKTAGFKRLDPSNSPHFAAHWCFLWQCVCAILTED